MCFPNPKEVDRACYFGKIMEIKVCDAIVSLSPWTAAVGAKSVLHKAWVRVRNIPSDKRCEKHIAYAGSLVGITLEVDQATVHKPEYCRILLGCRDIDELPETAEGVLGDYFYDFSYEVESVVVRGPPAQKGVIPISSSSIPPSPKRARLHNNFSKNSAASSEGQTGAASVGTNFGKSYCAELPVVSEHESEEESEDDSELLIHQMAKENAEKGMGSSVVIPSPICESNTSLTPTVHDSSPQNTETKKLISADLIGKQIVPSFAAVVSGYACSHSPVVTEVEDVHCSAPESESEYFVQSPPSDEHGEARSGTTNKPVEPIPCDLRNQEAKMSKVMDNAAALAKKRNLEGNQQCSTSSNAPSSNAFSVLSNNEIMLCASMMGVNIPSDDFEHIDLIREIENSRNSLLEKNNKPVSESLVIHHDCGVKSPLHLEWHDEEEDDSNFTLVQSRKSKKINRRKNVVAARPITRSQKKV
jgi:hypothetical protein